MTEVSRPVMLDFSEVFTLSPGSPKCASPVRARLEEWTPTREVTENKLVSATERRELELSKKKKVRASRVSKADAVKQQKLLEAAKLAENISKKVEAALQRAENLKKERTTKCKEMSGSRVKDFRKEQKTSIEFTREMNEKSHAEAIERAERIKNAISKKCSNQNVSKFDEVKQRTAKLAEEKKTLQGKRHDQAYQRRESAKRARSLIGAKMSVSKVEEVKQTEQAVADQLKLAQKEKHAQAEARALQEKTRIVSKSEKRIARVQAARALHYKLLEASLAEKKNQAQEAAVLSPAQPPVGSIFDMQGRPEAPVVDCSTASTPFPVVFDNDKPAGPIQAADASLFSPPPKKKVVVTLRKDSPEGAHVVSIVAPHNDDQDKAESMASRFLAAFFTS